MSDIFEFRKYIFNLIWELEIHCRRSENNIYKYKSWLKKLKVDLLKRVYTKYKDSFTDISMEKFQVYLELEYEKSANYFDYLDKLDSYRKKFRKESFHLEYLRDILKTVDKLIENDRTEVWWTYIPDKQYIENYISTIV